MRTDTKNLIKLHNLHIKAAEAGYIEPIEILLLLLLLLMLLFMLLLLNVMMLLLKYYFSLRDEENLEHQDVICEVHVYDTLQWNRSEIL